MKQLFLLLLLTFFCVLGYKIIFGEIHKQETPEISEQRQRSHSFRPVVWDNKECTKDPLCRWAWKSTTKARGCLSSDSLHGKHAYLTVYDLNSLSKINISAISRINPNLGNGATVKDIIVSTLTPLYLLTSSDYTSSRRARARSPGVSLYTKICQLIVFNT